MCFPSCNDSWGAASSNPSLSCRGWDKTYCLRYVKDSFYLLHFFGDKTHEGGNDAEIFHSPLTVGHTVSDPDNTKEQCESLFMQDS